MSIFQHGRYYFENGEYVRRADAVPGNGLEPVVKIEESLGTIEIPCGKVDCRANCLEYVVRSPRTQKSHSLSECKLAPLVNLL